MTVAKTELAEDRTNWAEDRTLMASERTFASWLRTALAAIGVGLGMQVVFDSFEPTWVAKLISSLFMVLAIGLIVMGRLRDRAVARSLSAHCLKGAQTGWEIWFLRACVWARWGRSW
jgi:putative membrane protein